MVELVGDEAPAGVEFADAHGIRYPDVVVEGGGGVRLAEGLEGLDGEPRVGCVDEEHGDALVCGSVWICPGGEPHVVGVVGEAGEQLLSVDHPAVAVPDRSGSQRGQVGAGIGFRVADREVHLAGQDPPQEEVLLLVGAEPPDGRPDGVGGQEWDGTAGSLGLVEEDVLLDGGEAPAAVLDRPSDPQPAVGPDLSDEGLVVVVLGKLRAGDTALHLGRHQVAEVGPELHLQGLLVVGEVDEHLSGAPSVVSSGGCPARRHP